MLSIFLRTYVTVFVVCSAVILAVLSVFLIVWLIASVGYFIYDKIYDYMWRRRRNNET